MAHSYDFYTCHRICAYPACAKFAGRTLYLHTLLNLSMMKLLQTLWKKWMQLGIVIGNFMSGVFLIVFYFTVFALFAIPFRLLSRPFQAKSAASNWNLKNKTLRNLEDFRYEH